MATPTYLGAGQPLPDARSSWLGRFGTFFGGATPAYTGYGQPSASASFLGGSPAYAQAPAGEPCAPVCQVVAPIECPIDPNALAAGLIAIVIPRLQPIAMP